MIHFAVFNIATGDVVRGGSVSDQDIDLQTVEPTESLVTLDEHFDPITQSFDPQTGDIVPRIFTDAEQLTTAKASLLKKAERMFARKVGEGFTYNSATYQMDAAQQLKVAGATLFAMVATSDPSKWPEGGYPFHAENGDVAMFATPADFIAFGLGVEGWFRGLDVAFINMKNAIAALSTLSACTAFDVTQGWP